MKIIINVIIQFPLNLRALFTFLTVAKRSCRYKSYVKLMIIEKNRLYSLTM